MPRRMADPTFRDYQWQHRYDAHVAPINSLVDSLCKPEEPDRSWAPYVAPMYGGIDARLLSLLRDPGPKTRLEGGSGFLSMENDDATAERICDLVSEAGISAADMVPWNVFPWYINRSPKASEVEAGLEPLRDLIQLLPRLRVVMLHGETAREGWTRLERTYPELLQGRGINVIGTYHTSRQAFWHRDPTVRKQREADLRAAFAQAARLLGNA